jgi:thymidylate synthase (FAD)
MQKGHVVNVLDHGYLKLVDWMGTEEDIIRAARMSTGRGFERWDAGEVCKQCRVPKEEIFGSVPVPQPATESGEPCWHDWVKVPGDEKLLERLYKFNHATPFEMCVIKVEVQAPIMVFREWQRHRTWGYNEFSARYSQMPNLHYLPDLSRVQRQSKTNKQGSAEPMGEEWARNWLELVEEEQGDVYERYDWAIKEGLANELARIDTPVSRYSKMQGIVCLRNVLAFLTLRKEGGAQWEIRQFADVLGNFVQALWPRTYALWEEHTFYAKKFSRSEHEKLKSAVAALRLVMDRYTKAGYELEPSVAGAMASLDVLGFAA